MKNGAVCAVCTGKRDINPVDFPPATPPQLCFFFFLLNQNDLWRRRIRHHSQNFLKTSLNPSKFSFLSQSCLLTPGRLLFSRRRLGASDASSRRARRCSLLMQLLFMAVFFCLPNCASANVQFVFLRGSLCVSVCVRNWRGFCLRALLHLYILKYVPVRMCRLLRAEPKLSARVSSCANEPESEFTGRSEGLRRSCRCKRRAQVNKVNLPTCCKVCRAAETE